MIRFQSHKIRWYYKQYYYVFSKIPNPRAKAIDLADWCLVADIMKKKGYLTQEYLDKIKQIKGINRGRN